MLARLYQSEMKQVGVKSSKKNPSEIILQFTLVIILTKNPFFLQNMSARESKPVTVTNASNEATTTTTVTPGGERTLGQRVNDFGHKVVDSFKHFAQSVKNAVNGKPSTTSTTTAQPAGSNGATVTTKVTAPAPSSTTVSK